MSESFKEMKYQEENGAARSDRDAESGQGRIGVLKALFKEFAEKNRYLLGDVYAVDLNDIYEDFRDYFYNVKDTELEELFINLDEETFEQWRDELYEKWDKEGGD